MSAEENGATKRHIERDAAASALPADWERDWNRTETLLAEIAALDPDELSPREALEALYALKRMAANRE